MNKKIEERVTVAEPIIFNDTDFEENIYNIHTCMLYKGKPFTGTLIIEGDPTANDFRGNREIKDYKDGNAHGRVLEYHWNGLLIYEGTYVDGEPLFDKDWFPDGQLQSDWNYGVSGKEWYEGGQLKKHWDGKDTFIWDEDGILARKNYTWFYKNGQKTSENSADGTLLYFAPSGEVAYKQEKLPKRAYEPESRTGQDFRFYYYDDVMSRFCYELFTDHYPDLGEENFKYRMLSLFGWVGAVYSENKERGHQLIDGLMNHHSKITCEHAGYLKRLAIKKEAGSDECTYWLEKSPYKILVI